MRRFLNFFLGCSHPQYSWPITWRVKGVRRTTVSCLTCGKELNYSWERMEVVDARKSWARRTVASSPSRVLGLQGPRS